MLRLFSKTRIFEQTACSTPEETASLHKINCDLDAGNEESDLIVGFPDIPRALSSKKLKREVRISSRATVHEPDVREARDECKPYSPWYSNRHYKLFRRDTKNEVLLARRRDCVGLCIDGENEGNEDFIDDNLGMDDDQCIAGIERLVSEDIAREIAEEQRVHRRAVLDEYWRQVAFNDLDPQQLRKVSRIHSNKGKVRAWKYATGMTS